MDTEYNIAYKKIRPDATAPACHKDGRVLDIYAAEDVLILPGETVEVRTGWAFVFPDELGLMFMPVDGLSSKSSLRYAERAFVLQNNYYKQEEVVVKSIDPVYKLLCLEDKRKIDLYYINEIE